MPKYKKPDLDEALGRFTLANNYWGPLHREQEIDYLIANNRQEIWVPNGYNKIYTGTAAALLDSAASHIAGEQPQISVPEASNSVQARDRSERIEKGLQAAQTRIDAAQTDNIRRTLVYNGLWSGMYVSRGPIFDPYAWGETPERKDYEDDGEYEDGMDAYLAKKKLNWPIYRKAVDPRWVFPDPGTTGKKWVMVRYMRTVGSIQDQWDWDGRTKGMDKKAKPLDETYLVDWLELWTEYHRIYLAGGSIIDKVREHGYAKPPFQIRSAGYGIDTGRPEERFRSIIYPARSLINQQIAALNQLDAIMRRTAWPVILQPTGAGMDEVAPGTIKDIPLEYITQIRAFTEFQPAIVQGLMQELEFLDGQIEQATFPNVVRGFRAKGISSGYGQNSLVAEAKVKFGPAVVNLEALEEEFNIDLANCVQHVIEEPVPVWGNTRWGKVDAVLDPKDLSDLRHVEVTINPKMPTDRSNEATLGKFMQDAGWIDNATAIQEFAGYQNPGEMMEKIAADRALNSPGVQNVINLAALLEQGYLKKIVEAGKELGLEPFQTLQLTGIGAMLGQQQGQPGAVPGQPQNMAAQLSNPAASMFGGNNKTQPGADLSTGPLGSAPPGSPQAVRDEVVPGLAIGG